MRAIFWAIALTAVVFVALLLTIAAVVPPTDSDALRPPHDVGAAPTVFRTVCNGKIAGSAGIRTA